MSQLLRAFMSREFTVSIIYRLPEMCRLASLSVFGKELRQLRLKAGLTQEEVAASASVSREYVSMLEADKNIPTIDVFMRLCHAVNAYPADVISRLDHVARNNPPRK